MVRGQRPKLPAFLVKIASGDYGRAMGPGGRRTGRPGSPSTGVSDGFPEGVMHLKPGQQAGGRKDQAHGGLRSSQGKAAAPAADLLAVPNKHAEAGTIEEGQPG